MNFLCSLLRVKFSDSCSSSMKTKQKLVEIDRLPSLSLSLYSIFTNLTHTTVPCQKPVYQFLFPSSRILHSEHAFFLQEQLITNKNSCTELALTQPLTLEYLFFSLFFTSPDISLDLGQSPVTTFTRKTDTLLNSLHKLSRTQLMLLTHSNLTLSIL